MKTAAPKSRTTTSTTTNKTAPKITIPTTSTKSTPVTTTKTITPRVTTTKTATPRATSITTKSTPRSTISRVSSKTSTITSTTPRVTGTTPRLSPSSGTTIKTATSFGTTKTASSHGKIAAKNTASKSSPIIAKWDKGTKTVRQQMLIEFLTTHKKQDNINLVDEYGGGASLFLARLIASLRITFNEGLSSSQLLRGIGVFIKSGEELFLIDFVESGSLSTVLDLLIHNDVSEDDKQDALELLSNIIKQS